MGQVKGRVVDNGEPIAVDGQAALMLYRINDAGQPDEAQSYPIPLEKDGTFELVASGGSVPPGTYLVTLMVHGADPKKGIGRYKNAFPYPDSKLKQTVEPGSNEVTIDLSESATK